MYNANGAVITYDDKESEHTRFRFYNNILVGKDELVRGKDIIGNDVFLHNDWWSLTFGFNIDGIKDFKTWAVQTRKERENGKVVGYNEDPKFKKAGHISLTSPVELKAFFNSYPIESVTLKNNLPVYK